MTNEWGNASSSVPNDLRYSHEHEWVRLEGDLAYVGITAYAQDELGAVVYVDLPRAGVSVDFMGKLGEIESVKVASEVFSPVAGEVAAINEDLRDAPELVNDDPYGKGWLVALRLSDTADLDRLLSAEGYRELIAQEQGH